MQSSWSPQWRSLDEVVAARAQKDSSSAKHGDFPEGLPRAHEGVRSSSSSNSGGEATRGQNGNSRSNLEERSVPPQRQTGKTSRGDDNEEPEDREDEQEGFTATLRRASMTLGAGIGGLFGVGGDSPAVPQPEQQPPHGGVASSSSASGSERPRNGSNGLSASQQSFQATGRAVAIGSRLADGCSQTVDVHRLLKETRRPFRRLIMEVQTPQLSCTKAASGVTLCDARGDQGTNGNGAASSSAEARDEQSRDAQARSPLLSAIVRARLIGYVLGCCEAVTSELSPDEARLWDAFVTADIKLTGTIAAATELRQVLIDCFGESEHTSSWCRSMGANADENGEIDFADLLDWYTTTSKVESLWFVRSSVRDSLVAGLGQILNASAARQTAPRMRPERISQLRTRCADLAPTALAEAAVAYQRSLMLTSCWQCENRLMAIIKSASTAQGQNEQRTSLVHTLLSVLRSINSELAPTERVLWEVIGSKDSDFDCSFTKQEVLAGIGELLVYTLERELATPSEEFEELQRLRSECQRRSVETLFQEGRLTASLSDVIWWWWDLPEEYRIAAGLSVPAALLRRSVTRKPEEMFKDKLRLAATNASVANTALRGHVRAYAELRALVVRRTVEGLHCRSPTETWTTCTSDAGTSRAPSSERKRGSGVVESDD